MTLGALHPDLRASLALLFVLLAVSSIPAAAYRYHPRDDTTLKQVVRTLQKRGLNRQASASQTAGYYEGLLDEATNVTRVGGRGWLDWRFWLVERGRRTAQEAEITRRRDDFLSHELKPGLDLEVEGRRLVTNSAGLADREYAREPAPGTWRIALVGDSVSQGRAAGFGLSYEARLEDHLNRRFAGGRYDRYEILNFAVQGYQLTQLVDVTQTRVPSFSPNVYVVALTERSVITVWADHLASLIRNRVDLKYDFLKRVANEAQLAPNLSSPLINARLAPYRVPILRWALAELQGHARRSGVPLVVLLLPTADDPEMQIGGFRETKQLLAELSIATADLLETFVELDDLAPVRVSAFDRHPNADGHKMLFERLLALMDSDAGLREVLTGGPARPDTWPAAR